MQELLYHLWELPLVLELLRVHPEERQVWTRPLAMVRRVEEVQDHPKLPWELLVLVSVRLARRGRVLHRQVLVRLPAI